MGLSRINHNNIKNQWLAVLFTLIPGAALSAPSPSNGDLEGERWFQVELIVFAHKNSDALDSEDWPRIGGPSLPEDMVELRLPRPGLANKPSNKNTGNGAGDSTASDQNNTTSESKPVAFEILPEEEMRLKDAIRKLARSSRFEPLLHVAWRQPTFDKEHAQIVLLYDGMTEPVTGISDKTAIQENTETGPVNPRVVGTVQLSVARYLHLAADLVYRTPVTERVAIPVPDLKLWYDKPFPTLSDHQGPAYQLEEWNVIRSFRLQESRRMRSKKMHYLDHPFFGVVVLVTPIKFSDDTEEETAPDSEFELPLQNH